MPVIDPFLLSINDILMKEGMEDATCMQEDDAVPYQAILCSLYDIIGEHPPPPKSSAVSSSCEHLFDLHSPHQIANKQQVMRYNGFNKLTHQMLNSGASRVTLPANGNLQSSFSLKETADTSLEVPRLAQHLICPSSANFDALSTQDHHVAIKFNDGQLFDTKVSCWEKDKALNKFRSCSGRGSNAHFQLPSPYKEFSLKLAGVELSFEDLKLHDHYEALYVRKPGIPIGAPKYGSKGKSLAVAGKSKKRTADAQEYVDLNDLIVRCAQAVAVGDASVANEHLHHIQQVHGASPDGNGSQRAAHYFSEALVARMRGTGGHYFRALLHKKPSVVTMLKSYKLWFELTPFVKVMHYFANRIILKVAERASRLHILDYGLECGIQWPFLINALADQKGGPPLLVITAINSPQPGNNPAQRLEESGRRLAAYARTYNVPFQFHAIACSMWEDLQSSSFHFHEDEVLVVNCIKGLRHHADESVDLISPRQKLLNSIHSLKPHLLITADVSAAYNSPFFVSRFREAFYYFSSLFDMLDTLSTDDSPERLLREKIYYYGDILNIVACEGAERVKRAETYKQLEVRIKRAGFAQMLIPPAILSRSRYHVKQHYHKDFFVHDDASEWMLLGWKGRTSVAISAWKLSHVQLSCNGAAQ